MYMYIYIYIREATCQTKSFISSLNFNLAKLLKQSSHDVIATINSIE